MLYTKFQAPEPSGSEEEDFWIHYIFFTIFFYVFIWFVNRTLLRGTILDHRTFIWTNLVKDHQAMLQTKFHTSEPSGSEDEDFEIFFYVCLRFEPRIPWPGAILDPGTYNWPNLVNTTRQCYIQNFKHLGQEILKKKIFEYFFMYFFDLNLNPPGAGPSWFLGALFE